MLPDLIKWSLALLSKLGPWNAKIEQIWPILKNIAAELQQILTISNGGKPLTTAGGSPQTEEGKKLAGQLAHQGISTTEANQFVNTLEAVNDRVSLS